jgi:hypothetical protein
MKHYRLIVRNELLFTRAALKHQNRIRVVNLLLDSGSTYTIGSNPFQPFCESPIRTIFGLGLRTFFTT